MSDWILYHVWGIRGYRPTHWKMWQHPVVVTLEPLPSV
jgi:hypothetical protein